MNARVDHLLDEVLGLPAEERSAVAAALIDSLEETEDAAVSDAWKRELLARREALHSGSAKAVSWAEAEFREAILWYFERSPLAAGAFRTEVFDKIDRLMHDADSWPKDQSGIHFRILTRFPYTVHYDLTGAMATVLAVAHHRRAPGYWRPRGT